MYNVHPIFPSKIWAKKYALHTAKYGIWEKIQSATTNKQNSALLRKGIALVLKGKQEKQINFEVLIKHAVPKSHASVLNPKFKYVSSLLRTESV